ncbi:MAG: cytochrome b [Burkholderiales bacterium 68-12]|nr:MAG: cytochrome b [Burkholderiales bacterium 68-12]
MAPTPPARYHGLAIALHWLLALMLVAMFGVGVYMVDLPVSPQRLKLYNWHKWAGIAVLALSLVRLLWRLARPAPPLPASVLQAMPGWQRQAHQATHVLMYLLFFAVPLAGWAYSSAAGFPVVWFGRIALPDFVPVSKALADAFQLAHSVLAMSLALLVLAHVAAALKHHWVDRDGLLARMLPGR